jgi:hypothetical protein
VNDAEQSPKAPETATLDAGAKAHAEGDAGASAASGAVVGSEPASPDEEGPTLFVSDPSAEAERIAERLRAAGYLVVDVPLSMLVGRVAVQRPRVLIIDVDGEGALEAVARIRELPDCAELDIIFLGRTDSALAHESGGLFQRPVDVDKLLEKVRALLQSSAPPKSASSVPPPRSGGYRSVPPAAGERPSERPPPSLSLRSLSPPPSLRSERRAATGPLSSELESLLLEAEARVGPQLDVELPSPEEELDAVLPEELLAALDEPIEADDDRDDESEAGARQPTTSGGRSAARSESHAGAASPFRPGETSSGYTGVGTSSGSTTNYGTQQGRAPASLGGGSATGSLGRTPSTKQEAERPEAARRPTPPPPPTTHGPLPSMLSSTLGSEFIVRAGGMLPAPPPTPPPAVSAPLPTTPPSGSSKKAGSVPPPPAPFPSVLGPGDAGRVLARAIAGRMTGCLTFESEDGVRRVVMRDGDVITAGSGAESESLLAFLVARGDLPRETLQQLAGRLPAYGKHAGAALVAHGLLTQDQLWEVLRAHAEWILGCLLRLSQGTVSVEPEAPGRLRSEPNVFGAAAGAAVLVEVARRVVSPEEAVGLLGGPSARVGDGPHANLLRECGLSETELALIESGRGRTVGEVVAERPELDVAPVLYALGLLGVLEPIAAIGASRESAPAVDADTLDVDALRARVRARAELVDEGDYFAVLGVPRTATGYEVRRAFLDLRRTFDPARILVPQIADLADDVRKIVLVLEEAYEILKDPSRRERYRRAIDEAPR